jgi:ankyrin repeat protein
MNTDMEDPAIVKANLIIAMQTQNIRSYKEIIKSTIVPLFNIKDSSGCNLFHDIACQMTNEDYLLEIFQALVHEFNERYYEESNEILKSMLAAEKKSDLNTPFLDAIIYNRKVISIKKILRKFAENGANINVKNCYGEGPAHLAAERGLDAILVYLCKELGLMIDEKDMENRTPLLLAAMHGNATTCAFLIAWKANIQVVDNQGNTCLHLAAASQNYKLVRLFLIKGLDPCIKNIEGSTAYEVANALQSKDIEDLLVFFM